MPKKKALDQRRTPFFDLSFKCDYNLVRLESPTAIKWGHVLDTCLNA